MANRITYSIGFTVDKSSLNDILKSLKDIENQASNATAQGKMTQGLKDAASAAKQLEGILNSAWNSKLNQLDLSKVNKGITQSYGTVSKLKTELEKSGNVGVAAFNNFGSKVLTTNLQLRQSNKLLDSMAVSMANTVKWGITSSIFKNIATEISNAYNYTKQLDASLNDIRIVTGKSAEDMEHFAIEANRAAKALAGSTRDYTEGSLIYYQQGLDDAEVQARTEVTLKAANVTGQTGAEVSEQLTAIWNGYKVSAEEAELYIDKVAAVAATTASDLEELATGMSKVASAADLMGVDIDQLNAQIATIISVTRQAPESVGTALKTIYARMGDIEAGIDTETTLGNYTQEMAAMGVNVLDMNGQLRDMGEVIEEIGGKWSTMSREQQIALSQTMAGTRQYNNLLSLFDNWDMYTEALNTSAEAAGTLQEQQDIYMERTDAQLQQLRTEAQNTYTLLFDTDVLNGFINIFDAALSGLNNFIEGIDGGVSAIVYFGGMIANIFNTQIAKAIATAKQNFDSFRANIAGEKIKEQIIGAGVSNFNKSQGLSIQDNSAGYKAQLAAAKEIFAVQKGLTQEQYNESLELNKQIGLSAQKIDSLKKQVQENENIKKSIIESNTLSQEVVSNPTALNDLIIKRKEDLDLIKNTKIEMRELYYLSNEYYQTKLKNEGTSIASKSGMERLFKNETELIEGFRALGLSSMQIDALWTNITDKVQEGAFTTKLLDNTLKFISGTEQKINLELTEADRLQKAIKNEAQQDLNTEEKTLSVYKEQNAILAKQGQQNIKYQNIAKYASSGAMAVSSLTGAISAYSNAAGDAASQTQAIGSGIGGLAAAIGMAFGPIGSAIGIAISALVTGVSSMIAQSKREAEQAIQEIEQQWKDLKENIETTKTNISSLQDVEAEFSLLSKGVSQYGENISLTADQYERYKEIISQVAGMSDELVLGYDAQGNAILDNNNLIERTIELLKEEQIERKKALLTEDNINKLQTKQETDVKEDQEKLDSALKEKNTPYATRWNSNTTDELADFRATMSSLPSQLFFNDRERQEQLATELFEIRELYTEENSNFIDSEEFLLNQEEIFDRYKKVFEDYNIDLEEANFKDFENLFNKYVSVYSGEEVLQLKKELQESKKQINDAILAYIQVDDSTRAQYENLAAENQAILNKAILNIVQGETYEDRQPLAEQLLNTVTQIANSENQELQDQLQQLQNPENFDSYQDYINNISNFVERLKEEDIEFTEEDIQNLFGFTHFSDEFDTFGNDITSAAGKLEKDLKNKFGEEINFSVLSEFSFEDLEDVFNWSDLGINLNTIGSYEEFLEVLESIQNSKALDNQTKQTERLFESSRTSLQTVTDALNEYNSEEKLSEDTIANLAVLYPELADIQVAGSIEYIEKLKEIRELEKENAKLALLKANSAYDEEISSIDNQINWYQEKITENNKAKEEGREALPTPVVDEYTKQIEKLKSEKEKLEKSQKDNSKTQQQAYAALLTSIEEVNKAEEEGLLSAEVASKRKANIIYQEREALGMSEKAFEEYTKSIQNSSTALKNNTDMAQQFATNYLSMQNGVDSLSSSWKDLKEKIENGIDFNSIDFINSADQVSEDLKQALGVSFDIPISFVENPENQQIIEAFLNGDITKLEELRKKAVIELIVKTKPITSEEIEALNEYILNLDLSQIEIGTALNAQPFYYELMNMLMQAQLSKDEITEILEGIGFSEIELTYVPGTGGGPGRYISTKGSYQGSGGVTSPTKKGEEDKEATLLEKEADAYAEINNEISYYNNQLEELKARQEDLEGADLLENLHAQHELQEKLLEIEREKLAMKQAEAELVKNELAGQGIKFDENGLTTNREEVYNRLVDRVNTARNGGVDENIKAAEKALEDFEEAIDNYDNIVLQDIPDSLSKINDALDELDSSDIVEDFINKFYELDREIKDIEEELDDLKRAASRLEGIELIQNLEQQKKVLDRQIAVQEKKIKLQQIELKQQQDILRQYMAQLMLEHNMANIKLQFADDGTIKNYLEIWGALTEKASEITETEMQAIANMFETYNTMVESVESMKDELDNLFDSQQDIDWEIEDEYERMAEEAAKKLEEEMNERLRLFNLEADLKLDVAEARRQWNEFKRKVIDDIDDSDILGNAKARFQDFFSYYGDGLGSIGVLTEHVNDIMGEINLINEGGTSSLYGTDKEQALEDMKNYRDQLVSALEEVVDLQNELEDSYMEMIDKIADKFSEQVELYGTISDTISHDMELIRLIRGEDSYDELAKYYEQQQANNNSQLILLKEQVNYWKSRMDSTEEGSEEWEKYKENWKSAVSELNSTVDISVQNLIDKYQNMVNKVFEDLDNSVTNYVGLDYLSEEWDLINKNADKYLDKVNSLFEIDSLENKFQQAIDDTDSLKAQQRLTELMNEQLEMLREKDKLTQYDVDRANLLYELELKKIALEEAQQNKSQLRLRRDSQGNYSYQYVADQEAVGNAEQELSEAQNSVYNLDKDQYNQNLNEIYDLYTEFQEKLSALYQDQTLTEEEREQKKQLLVANYGELINGTIAENEVIRQNLQQSTFDSLAGLYGMSVQDFQNMTDAQKEIMMNQMIPEWDSGLQEMANSFSGEDGFITMCEEAIKVLEEATKEYQDGLAELEEAAGINFGNLLDEGIDPTISETQELINTNDELIGKYEQELDVIGSLISELDSLREMYGEIERAAYAAVEEALRLQEANTTGNAKTSDGSTTTTATTSNKNKNKNKGSGNSSGGDDGDSGGSDGDDSHPTFASSTSTKKGDGTPAVGDEVTYKSGRYYYDSYGSDPSGNQELGNKVRITYLNPGADFPIHISRLSGGDLGWLKKSQISGYDTGGYTGEWGDSGKLALLHEKELVLNKQDTPNILAAVSIVRDMASVLSNLESAAFSQMSGLMSATVQTPNIGIPAQTLEQDVRIEANFPNVSNSNEIEQAFNNLVNAASQHAFNTKR